jgi:deoxyribonuclease-4
LINICSKNTKTEKQSVVALEHELERCAQLGIPYLVLHPGAHLGAGEEKGLEKITNNLELVLAKTDSSVSVLLETMAHQGTTLGHTFEQIKTIRNACTLKKRIGACLDTCHIIAAGYDLQTEAAYKQVIKNFDNVLGLSLLKAMHLNNSKDPLGSHIDRHAPIEQGKIPLHIFELIMKDQQLTQIPKILETPTEVDMKLWKKEIELLKSFVY